MYYIVTFHSNFDANTYIKKLQAPARMQRKPVPRQLSSSCGTCVVVTPTSADLVPSALTALPFETIYQVTDEGQYTLLYQRD